MQSIEGLGRILLGGVAAYAVLVVFLRLSGKRTLTKLNAFDLVVTVALGSTLSTVIVNKKIPLVEGIAAMGVLVALQFAVAWLSSHFPPFGKLVKSEPTTLYKDGAFLEHAMLRERITKEEILAAIRHVPRSGTDRVDAVVLETSGDLSVIVKSGGSTPPA